MSTTLPKTLKGMTIKYDWPSGKILRHKVIGITQNDEPIILIDKESSSLGPPISFAWPITQEHVQVWGIDSKYIGKFGYVLNKNDSCIVEVISEGIMNTDKIKSVVVSSAKEMGESAKDGLILATVAQANDIVYKGLTDLVVKMFDAKRETMEDPAVRAIVMGLFPLLLHPAASMMEGQIPYTDQIKQYAKLSMTEEARTHSLFLMQFITELFSTMVFAGEQEVNYKFTPNYSEKNMEDLRDIAKQRRIKVDKVADKDQLVTMLEEADAQMEERLRATA